MGSAREAPGGRVVRKGKHAYIDVLFPGRRTSNSAPSFHRTDSNRLRLMNTRKSDKCVWKFITGDLLTSLSTNLDDVVNTCESAKGRPGPWVFASTSCGFLLFVACNRIGKHMEA